MKNIKYFMTATFILLLPLTANTADSEGILSKLLAPGPLIEGHKDLDGSCTKCHDTGKGVPASQCLECHKEIKASMAKKQSFHGLAEKDCIQCHSDHKGRTNDTTKIDEKVFDHKLTGFSLEGKHAELKCSKCHVDQRSKKPIRANEIRYFGKVSTCVGCHKKDDVHFFKGQWAQKDCNACHNEKTWKGENKFNHERDAKYKLEGKHAKMKCAECHVPPKKKPLVQYNWPQLKAQQCMTCHDDFHKANLSGKFRNGKCATCHLQTEWKIEEFAHKVTGYPLRGKHSEIKCIDCHKQTPAIAAKNELKEFKFQGLKSDCLACHKDYHLFGSHKAKNVKGLNQCLNCHTEKSWKESQNFDHNKQTRYVLDGKHTTVTCKECHAPEEKGKAPPKIGTYFWPQLTAKTCENCHKSPHIGQFSAKLLAKKCTECHVTEGWFITKDGKHFDHASTRFPLDGKHADIRCSQCHQVNKKPVYKFENFEKKFCISCHKNEHIGQFSSKFSEKVCLECHNTKKFTDLTKFDHGQTRYTLKGEHIKTDCNKCHTPTKEKYASTREPHAKGNYHFSNFEKCTSCHVDYHKNQLGQNCTQCHSESGWKPTTFDHGKTQFPLRGKHETLKCEECHKGEKNNFVLYKNKNIPVVHYKPLGKFCTDCHKDPHRSNFGTQCLECHTERDWRITRDFHKNFTLSGIHYQLECGECHKNNRRLAGMSQQCTLCHQKDDRHHGTLPNCGECHRQQFWENAEYKHSLTRFPLRGAHRTLDCVECHANGIYQGLPNDCYSCHKRDAANATTFNHFPVSNFTSCTDCHKNQFAF